MVLKRVLMRRWGYLLLLLLAATLFWRLWFTHSGFLHRPVGDYSDLTITHWPNAFFIRHSLATWGQVPLWRHLILGGEPFAANPLSGLWYPPNLLLLIFPLTLAFNLLFILHTAWAGWGAYRLARSIGASQAGGFLAAFIMMFTPKAVVHLASGHVGLYCAWAWLPWVIWSVRRLVRRGRPGDAATVATMAAMLILADVRLGFYGGLAAAGYWVVNLKPQTSNYKLQMAMAVGTVLLVGALVAIQMVPLAMASGRMNRGGLTLEESGIASLPPSYLVGLLVADHGGFQESMTYLGAVGLLLALVGLVQWRRRERWWWGGLALVAAIYSLGTNTPLYGMLYRVLPPLGWLRGPARAWFLVVLASAVLAARGLTALEEIGFRRRAWMDRIAVGLVGAVLAGGIGGIILRLSANVVAATVIWSLAGMLVTLRIGRRLRPALFAGLMLSLALLDLFYIGSTLYRVRPADEVLAEGEGAAAWLAEQPGRFRVYSPSFSIPQHTGAVYGIETVDGVDPFQLADYVDFMRGATGVDLLGYSVTVPSFPAVPQGEDMFLAHRGVVPDLHLLGLLNVRYVAAAYPMEAQGLALVGEEDGVYLYRNEKVLPRAFVVESEDVLENPDIDEARIVEWTPNRIQVEAEGPGLLVLSEVYDSDWQVRVDEKSTEMERVAGILRGVYLEEGQHQVLFTYWPSGLTVGIVLTAAAVVVVFGLVVAEKRHGSP